MKGVLVWAGGLALLAATAIDTLAVIGRQVGLPLHGSIELIQAAVLVAGSIALVLCTLGDGHAKVHLLVDRLRPGGKAMAAIIGHLLGAAFFACVLAGSVWLSLDLWHAHEVSEIVGVPWRWMRLFANLCLAALVIILIGQLATRPSGKNDR